MKLMTRQTFSEIAIGLALAAVAVLVLVFVVGCSSIKGGQSRHVEKGLSVEVRPDGTLVVSDTRSEVATTQPSVTTTANVLPDVAGAGEGEIGGIKFTEMRATVKANWWAFLIFGGCAFFTYYIGRWALMIGCIALAVLSIFYPTAITALAIGTLVVVAIVVVLHYKTQIKELVLGNEKALNSMPPAVADKAKLLMEAEHGPETKTAVAAITAPLDVVKTA